VPPDAIYATLDWLALGAMRAIQASGLSVPEDVMVAGATDSEAARWSRPSLTVLALDPGRIAQAAVAMLAELIEGREPRTRHVLIPTRILARASTRRTISAAAPAGRERG
jgi:LacI family transcriptional regulator